MQLNLLDHIHRLKIQPGSGGRVIWDIIRKKWVPYTPEEMVRQLTVLYLIEQKGISAGLIAVEKEVRLDKKIKRCDIIVYNAVHIPSMIIECKSPDVKLDQKVISQVVRYNQALDAKQLVAVNGLEYLVFEKGIAGKYRSIENNEDGT